MDASFNPFYVFNQKVLMKYTNRKKAYLVLEDGKTFEGFAIGKDGTTTGEICFNTGMTGYQEIYTDPSYTGQIIVNTSSHIGNYGAFNEDQESDSVKFNGLVCKSYSNVASRYLKDCTLDEYLIDSEIVGISDVDTRYIVRYIRSKGAMNAIISSEIEDVKELQDLVKKVPSMDGLELSSKVSTKHSYFLGDANAKYKVAVLDLGVKKSILTNLVKRDCYLKVFPCSSSFEEMKEWNPHGYFISNGPGDPAATNYAVQTVSKILDAEVPLFGICLGHQIIALANGATSFKMHHGHRGLNHPVKNLLTGLSEITSQNHGFSISKKSVEASDKINITHINLNDNTVEGIEVVGKPAFSVQHHPEASPGPHDSYYLFDKFISLFK